LKNMTSSNTDDILTDDWSGILRAKCALPETSYLFN